MEHAGHRSERRVQTKQQGDQAKVADGGKCQQPFQVMAEQRRPGADQQGGKAGSTDQHKPEVGTRQHRIEARQQEDACLDHGRRVQVRRHRRRCRHRMRQPEMKGELRRLGKDTEQHQHQDHRIQGMRANQVAMRQHHTQVITAHHLADQDDTGQQGEATGTGQCQRHARALARRRLVRPVTDQQERTDTGQLPEHHQQQQVVGGHHAQHGRHEQQQQREETSARVLLVEIIVCVQHHQRTDTENQQGKQPGQAIKAKCQRQPRRWQPRHGYLPELSLMQYPRRGNKQQYQRNQSRQQRGGRHRAPPEMLQPVRHRRQQQWQQNNDPQGFHVTFTPKQNKSTCSSARVRAQVWHDSISRSRQHGAPTSP